jgi:CBS domain containing-hemolysin-like protein
MQLFFFIFQPLIHILNASSNGLLKILGLHSTKDAELAHSEEEVRLILAHDTHGSEISRSIALNALDFHVKQARHAMVPRKEIVALSIDAPASESIATMRKRKFSRFPVYKDTIDNIVGIVYTKDIFKQNKHLLSDFLLTSVLRDAVFLPETATLETVLSIVLQKKTHMIILADEYGGTAGLITLENVLEELVGNIQDEYDRETPEILKIREGEYLIDGAITTNDVERLLGVELSPMDIRSIGGFIIEKLGHVPVNGEQLHMERIEFTVELVADNAIESVRVKNIIAPEELHAPPPTLFNLKKPAKEKTTAAPHAKRRTTKKS